MAKQDIIDYVMNTPGNTNKMVLEGMLGDTDGVKLPEISEEDEGKVLTVIDGKWDKGTASGGGTEPLIVTSHQDGNQTVLDKTWQEIYDASVSGKAVINAGTLNDGTIYARPLDSVFNNYNQMTVPPTLEYVAVFGDFYTTNSPSGYPSCMGSE